MLQEITLAGELFWSGRINAEQYYIIIDSITSFYATTKGGK